jgi:hypothetical protein
MGNLVCKTDDPYFPAFLTSVDDDTLGDPFSNSSGSPVTANNGAPYLDLTYCQDPQPSISNLRIRYADQGIATPTATRMFGIASSFNATQRLSRTRTPQSLSTMTSLGPAARSPLA